MAAEKPTNTHFTRYNAFIESGWLGVLLPIEAAVWFAMEKHARPDGTSARPSLATLAYYMRHTTKAHVGRALRSLCDHKLLAKTASGGGTEPSTYQVLPPPAPHARNRRIREIGAYAKSAHEGCADSAHGVYADSDKSPPITPSYSAEHPHEHPHEHPQRVADGDEMIYQAYPKHVGKRDAMKAIKNARKRVAQRGEIDPHAFLLGKVQLYAAARKRVSEHDPTADQFTPHPATWFNRGSYDDDPNEWENSNGRINGNAKPQRTYQTGRHEHLTL